MGSWRLSSTSTTTKMCATEVFKSHPQPKSGAAERPRRPSSSLEMREHVGNQHGLCATRKTTGARADNVHVACAMRE